MLRSHHKRSHISKRRKSELTSQRTQSQYGTKSYRDSLARAFNKAKKQIFFNPDMQFFITLTYKGLETDIDKVMYDIKQLVKNEKRRGNNLKYIYILEWQKRGSLHIHMITNNALTTYKNKNNHDSLTYWPHGFTSKLTINDFDSNFRPHLYLFKYMKKAQRIGKSFVHSSRNLNNFTDISSDTINLMQWRTLTQEYATTTVQNTDFTFIRNYLAYDDTIHSQSQINEKELAKLLWLEKVRLHSITALEKLVANHSPL